MTCIEMQHTEKPKMAPRKKNKKFKNLKIGLDHIIDLVQSEVDENPEIIHISNKQKNPNDK
ncbi:hypothetical protein [uncultured Photobacterium sp.]|uniref:hypothetical protein n=1 Tax=uncultured Photobacterium sp. TaxID=173973 RepID=UPI00260CA4F6|nr:hypothetical protein [uncultured Photobacterium sp.]